MIISTLALIGIITGPAAVPATATLTIKEYNDRKNTLPHNNVTRIDVSPCLFCDYEANAPNESNETTL